MDNSTKFEIVPLIGARPLEFGMETVDVDRLFGAADSVSISRTGQRVEHRSFMNVGYSAAAPNTLEHIGFGRQMSSVELNGILLFQDPEHKVLQALGRLDSQAFLYMGFVVFLRLGIALTGFHDGDTSQKAASLFPEGAWDKRREKLAPFAIPNVP